MEPGKMTADCRLLIDSETLPGGCLRQSVSLRSAAKAMADEPAHQDLSVQSAAFGVQRCARCGRRGFSLVELLVVVAIVGILAALTVPALSSMMQGNDLARGGQVVADQVNLARQTASAQNTVVEMRFIQLPNRPGYSAIQLWRSDSSGGMKPVRGMFTLPQSVTIAANPPLPGAMASLPTGTMPAGTTAASAAYAAVQIRPSGQVTPILAMSNLFFSVVPGVFANDSQLPPNYFLVQINPLTGVPLVYRP